MMKDKKFATKVIHAGGEPDKETGAVMPPIYQTSTYAQKSPGEHLGYEYTRSHNPTRTRLEENLAALENADYALTTASGLSMTSLIMQMFPKGSKILCGDDVYGGTYRLISTNFHERHDYEYIHTTHYELV
ncbi:MAG: PLP-dependent transferase, partial [Bacteriovoracaceae bacterium]